MSTASILIAVAIGLSAGNFIYQAAAGQNWAEATERTVFQLVAIAVVAGRPHGGALPRALGGCIDLSPCPLLRLLAPLQLQLDGDSNTEVT